MVTLYLLLIGLLVGINCDEADNIVDIGQTVKEVENILAEDPKLPRLTRGEIVTLIEEVRSGKDLMVVLPQQFNTTLEEMYTAKPVTQIISDNGQPKTTKRPKRRRKPIRPVYVHTTPSASSGETSETLGTTTETTVSSSTSIKVSPTPESLITEDWQPKLYVTPQPPIIGTVPPVTITTEAAQSKPDISVAAESLSPDMKELLSSFGLLGTPAPTTTGQPTFMIKSITPSVDPSSFSRFKPLPSASDGMSPDMKSFLASYGLLDIRKPKSLLPPPDPLEYLPHKDVLEELGLRRSKKLNHVFNPSSVKNSTEELHKVNKILMKLREFSDGNETNLSEDEVNELLLIENNTKLTAGEDPLDAYQSLATKIEVKRQQPNDTDITTQETTDEVATTSSASTSEEDSTEANVSASASDSTGASASDLEDSFGRGETSTRRPNGFYFLLDWNSFLDVGLEDRQVNLNFSPKVGDPRNFLPVTIP